MFIVYKPIATRGTTDRRRQAQLLYLIRSTLASPWDSV